MGVIKQGILGGFSGKVANVIGSSWKGIAYMKSMPLSVANPKTAAQVAQRTKITYCVAFAKIILSGIIKPLRDRFAVRMSGYNAFVQDNVDLFADTMPAPDANLVIASGKMAKTEMATLTAPAAETTLNLTWVDDSGEGFKLASDKAYIVAFCEETEEVIFESGDAIRSTGSASLDFSINNVADDNINCYLVFLREDGTVVSNTAFKSAIVA